MKNETKLIADSKGRRLTAYGKKLLWRTIDKAAQRYESNRYSPEMKEIKDKIHRTFMSLVFDQNQNEENIIYFINNIKVK